MGDVVHRELQVGPLGDVDQADACPGGTAVLWVGSLHHRHTLGGGGQEEEETGEEGGRGENQMEKECRVLKIYILNEVMINE